MYNNVLKYTYTHLLFTATTDRSTPQDEQYELEIALFAIVLLWLNLYFLYLLVDHINSNRITE